LIAFVSDAAMDFTPTDFDIPLTAAQQAYLKKELALISLRCSGASKSMG